MDQAEYIVNISTDTIYVQGYLRIKTNLNCISINLFLVSVSVGVFTAAIGRVNLQGHNPELSNYTLNHMEIFHSAQ